MKIINYNEKKYKVCLSFYIDNENTAIIFVPLNANNEVDENESEIVVTTNIHELPNRQVAIKNYSELLGMDKFLVENKIVKPKVLQFLHSGYVSVPVFEINDDIVEIYE